MLHISCARTHTRQMQVHLPVPGALDLSLLLSLWCRPSSLSQSRLLSPLARPSQVPSQGSFRSHRLACRCWGGTAASPGLPLPAVVLMGTESWALDSLEGLNTGSVERVEERWVAQSGRTHPTWPHLAPVWALGCSRNRTEDNPYLQRGGVPVGKTPWNRWREWPAGQCPKGKGAAVDRGSGSLFRQAWHLGGHFPAEAYRQGWQPVQGMNRRMLLRTLGGGGLASVVGQWASWPHGQLMSRRLLRARGGSGWLEQVISLSERWGQ